MKTADTTDQQTRAVKIMNALHEEGFTSLFLESVRVFSADRSPGNPKPEQIQHYTLIAVWP